MSDINTDVSYRTGAGTKVSQKIPTAQVSIEARKAKWKHAEEEKAPRSNRVEKNFARKYCKRPLRTQHLSRTLSMPSIASTLSARSQVVCHSPFRVQRHDADTPALM